MMNFKKENKELIEKNGKYKYYDYTEDKIRELASRPIDNIESNEWRMLIQMLYPKNLICSGLFQPIVIFEMNKSVKRKDPPIDAYDSMNQLRDGTCLFFRIMDFIKENTEDVSFNPEWYETKKRIKEMWKSRNNEV